MTPRSIASAVALLTAALSAGSALAQHDSGAQGARGHDTSGPMETGPEEHQLLVEQARAAAREDRNRESADLFALAIRRDPLSRSGLLLEYADQLTYSSRARQAVPLYLEVLDAEPGVERRDQALRGLGLAQLWSDRPGAARRTYGMLLDRHPDDQDARRNLAQALSWSGRQREAAKVLEALLRDHPDDRRARVQLAQAQAWMGRSEVARATLATVPEDAAESTLALRRDLARSAASRTRLDLQQSTQSDDLDIGVTRLTHEVPIQGGRGLAGLELARLRYDDQNSASAARVTRPTLFGRYRFSDAWELNGQLGNEAIDSSDGTTRDRLVYATWLTWWPNDVVRLDLSANRNTLDNLQSLRLGLTATQFALSMDLTPNERVRFNARVEQARFSDGNRRRAAQVAGEYRLHQRSDTWVGLRHARMTFSQQVDSGYFNPRELDNSQLTLRTGLRSRSVAPTWDVSASAAFGRERADPGGSRPTVDVGVRAGWALDANTRLEARLQRASSRTADLSGFERTTAGLTLERYW